MKNTQGMTREEKLEFYATAKRITTQEIQQFVDGELERFYVGKLRGNIVGEKDSYKFKTKEEAIACAREFRDWCREELEK